MPPERARTRGRSVLASVSAFVVPLLFASLLAAPAHAEGTSLPTYISTPQGWKHTENQYLPGTTHAELGWFAGQSRHGRRSECLKAQSICARTYVLRWLNAHGHGRRIPALGPSFQSWTSWRRVRRPVS